MICELEGKDLIALKDPDGKLSIKMIDDLAKTKGKGWTDTYKFRNPTTDKVSEKTIFVERVDDTWVGVGVYKQKASSTVRRQWRLALAQCQIMLE